MIEPLKHESFIASEKSSYEEIGVVVSLGDRVSFSHATTSPSNPTEFSWLDIGDKVFFDSWLAKKYPRSDSPGDFYWLVKFEDIVGYEKQVPEQPVSGKLSA